MSVPKTFREQGERAITSYNFSEFASGLGFITFYFAVNMADATLGYFLTENSSLYSENQGWENNTPKIDVKTETDIDFDLSPFSRPVVMDGTAVANLFTHFNVGGGGPYYNYTITIIKWDGTTETEIATATTGNRTVTSNTNNIATSVINIDVPLTKFKIGESLRVNLTTSTAGDLFRLFVDPANRDANPDNSSISIPFRVDI